MEYSGGIEKYRDIYEDENKDWGENKILMGTWCSCGIYFRSALRKSIKSWEYFAILKSHRSQVLGEI